MALTGKSAIDVVVAALQSGAIKLTQQPSPTVSLAEESAVADAAYLAKLITDLTAAIKALD